MTKSSKRAVKNKLHNSCAGKQTQGEVLGLDILSDELKQQLLDRYGQHAQAAVRGCTLETLEAVTKPQGS